MSVHPRLLPWLALLLVHVACTATQPSSPEPPLADDPSLPHVTSKETLQVVLDAVRQREYPELSDLSIELSPFDSPGDFFVANLVFETVSKPPRARSYLAKFNPRLFEDPPSNRAVYAILTHELKHVLDYSKMDEATLVDFAVKYATEDQTAYEHATDDYALAKGRARGLKAYRVWLYAHIDDEARAAKQREYYTPDELDAFLAAHPDLDLAP